MSRWASAIDAAQIAVRAPTVATVVCATIDRMVAAWMRAETGVGPSMASGSQTYRGICADLPAAPTRKRRPIAVAIPVPRTESARSNTPA
jgi:hypothetical protein